MTVVRGDVGCAPELYWYGTHRFRYTKSACDGLTAHGDRECDRDAGQRIRPRPSPPRGRRRTNDVVRSASRHSSATCRPKTSRSLPAAETLAASRSPTRARRPPSPRRGCSTVCSRTHPTDLRGRPASQRRRQVPPPTRTDPYEQSVRQHHAVRRDAVTASRGVLYGDRDLLFSGTTSCSTEPAPASVLRISASPTRSAGNTGRSGASRPLGTITPTAPDPDISPAVDRFGLFEHYVAANALRHCGRPPRLNRPAPPPPGAACKPRRPPATTGPPTAGRAR